MSLDRLIVKPATEDQAHEAVLREGAFAREGRFKIWVLTPEDDPDTTSFFASCQTLTREVLTLESGQTLPNSSFGHGVTSVFIPPEHRGKGYAKRLVSLLHSPLAPHRYPNPLKAPTAADYPSTVSVLYSAVVDYYFRCIPSVGELGWTVQKSFITTWPLPRAQISPNTSRRIELLAKFDVSVTLDSDDSNTLA
ncbi:hypothetical protein B0J17DRAFT_719248 [Rhizoctonia solani]|nr:hypothetical protein B0J17DRAFT_719248 [Rhizoctonia solani]